MNLNSEIVARFARYIDFVSVSFSYLCNEPERDLQCEQSWNSAVAKRPGQTTGIADGKCLS